MTEFPSPYSAESSDVSQWWRRPPDSSQEMTGTAGARQSEAFQYTGPPRSTPPPPGWRPPTVITVPAPRSLPPQDAESIDRAERQALVTTYGVAMVAGAIALLVLIVLCGRLVF